MTDSRFGTCCGRRPKATRSSSPTILRHLAETGAISQQDDGRWAAPTHLAPDEAITWYRRTLELLPTGRTTQWCEALVGLGTAQRQAGDPAHRETLLEAGRLAIDLHDDDLLVRAALANNRGDVSRFASIDDERVQILRRAIAARPRGPDGALLQATLAIELHGAPDEQVEEAASGALALAREAGDDRLIAHAVRSRARNARPRR